MVHDDHPVSGRCPIDVLLITTALREGGLQNFGGSLGRSVCSSLERDELSEQILEFRRQWPSDGGKILCTQPLTNCAQ